MSQPENKSKQWWLLPSARYIPIGLCKRRDDDAAPAAVLVTLTGLTTISTFI